MEDEQFSARELERRSFLKRAGVVAGATVWATPTIQSLASPAFAGGSPEECPVSKLIRFKYDVDTNKFDSGLPTLTSEAGTCLGKVDDYYNTGTRAVTGTGTTGCFSDNQGCSICVTISLTDGGKKASVTVTGGSVHDVDIKGGSSRSPNGYCQDGDTDGDGNPNTVTAPAGGAGISFVGGVICPKC